MKLIAEMVGEIREELEGAESYAKRATQYKQLNARVAENYATMSAQELAHVDALHAQIVRLIQDEKSAGKEVPAGMQTVWDWEHENMINCVARVKLLLDLYRK